MKGDQNGRIEEQNTEVSVPFSPTACPQKEEEQTVIISANNGRLKMEQRLGFYSIRTEIWVITITISIAAVI